MQYPEVDCNAKTYVCWCGKQCGLDDVHIIGGYHPEINDHAHFAYSNGCLHSAPLTTSQYVNIGILFMQCA